VPIIVTGSIATDHLMNYPGRFTDSLLPDQLERVSLSFLVDNLLVNRGGVAGNIAFGMGVLGLGPVLVDAVGADFDEYAGWLVRHGVNCDHLLRCDDVQTARFVCTTDSEMNQIGSFYSGAMSRSSQIDLQQVADAVGGAELVMIGAGDPDGMIKHTQKCRDNGYVFAADPSQQLAFMEGPQVLQLIDGAEYLFTNDYEFGLLRSKTGLTDEQILQKVHYRITTHGAKGVEIVSAADGVVSVSVVPETGKVDPTGVGDAFRSGFLSGRSKGLSLPASARLGALLATLVLETQGTQEHRFDIDEAKQRLTGAYGANSSTEIADAFCW